MGYRISVIGAGNGGQAMAAHLSLLGHDVLLFGRKLSKRSTLYETGEICLTGKIDGIGRIGKLTDDISVAVRHAEIIMVVTTADAHRELAISMAPFLDQNQIIVLNPGRTFGALEFRNGISNFPNCREIKIFECQTLVYACREEAPGKVRIIGIKDRVIYSSFPARDIHSKEANILSQIYKCMIPAKNTLMTGLENIGAILHPAIVIFNAATIERGQEFYFYSDMTPQICAFLEAIDRERLEIGRAYGVNLKSLEEWIGYAYKGSEGTDLLSKIKFNPAYYNILAPKKLDSRLLLEDIPTGILPMIELGAKVGLELPLMKSIYTISEQLLGKDFRTNGRTLKNLGIDAKSSKEIVDLLNS